MPTLQEMEEQRKMALFAAAIKNKRASSVGGMTNPYAAAPEQDFTGQERSIEAQRGAAQALRGAKTRPGQGVGPSNIFVQPHWSEGLATGVERAYGGYLSSKANKADVALDVERGLSKARAAEIENARYERTENRADLVLQQKINSDAATLKLNKAKLDETKGGKWDDVTVQLPNGESG